MLPHTPRLQAQETAGISPHALAQIGALTAEKASRTPVQRKISSNLLYAAKMARGDAIAQGVSTLEIHLPDMNARGAVVDIRAEVSQPLLERLVGLGAELLDVSARYENIRLRVALSQIEAIAALPQVVFVQPKQEFMTSRAKLRPGGLPMSGTANMGTFQGRKRHDRAGIIASVLNALGQDGPIANVGSRNSEGAAKHGADSARAIYGVSGTGVKIGVLSDGATNLAASQASGDLGAVTVLPGQAGPGFGDEGTAMLEIIHDLAPNAQLHFATAVNSLASFAQNIRDLRTAGCDIIVDDIGYYVETPFQDGQTATSQTNGGIVIQAVKDVTAAGAMYFSAAGNSGNKNDLNSGTWEGDFVDGGAAPAPLGGAGIVHNFGGQNYNVLHSASDNDTTLFWADPLGASANDYDLYRLNSAGTSVLASSSDFQTGTQDPFETMTGFASATNERIVIVKFSGAARFLHLATNFGRLTISTAGETHGHAATSAPNSFGVTATSALVNGLNPFNTSHLVETFSSDGPRRIFFQGNGTAITPGNFTSAGGQVLQKPDLTAADGVSVTGAGGYPTTFYGTSAAASHAAAIAGLVKSKNLALTATQIRAAMLTTTIDIEAPGVDRDAGYGIVMADAAVAVAPASPLTVVTLPATSVTTFAATLNATVNANGSNTTASFQYGLTTSYGSSVAALPAPVSGASPVAVTAVIAGLSCKSAYHVRAVGANSNGVTAGADLTFTTGTRPNRSSDFDGDHKADLVLYRGSEGTFYTLLSSANYTTFMGNVLGQSIDVPVPGDYDGDGKADLTVFHLPGVWWAGKSSTDYRNYVSYEFGQAGDTLVPADYDGDGRTDPAVYRAATGTWYVLRSGGGVTVQPWGLGTDKVVPGDYDGDGKADFALFRPSTGMWYILQSSTNYTTYLVQAWGLGTDITVPGDYDGDGRTDLALFRPSTATWWILRSSSNYTTYISQAWGLNTDIMVPADYDGDGKADLGVFRPSTGTWYILKSSANYTTYISQPWGLSTDVPVLKSP